LQQGAFLGLYLGFSRGMTTEAATCLIFEVEQIDLEGAPSDGPDGLGINANNLAELTDTQNTQL
jgi:hypothetical protein